MCSISPPWLPSQSSIPVLGRFSDKIAQLFKSVKGTKKFNTLGIKILRTKGKWRDVHQQVNAKIGLANKPMDLRDSTPCMYILCSIYELYIFLNNIIMSNKWPQSDHGDHDQTRMVRNHPITFLSCWKLQT